jgi:hypothetical protein
MNSDALVFQLQLSVDQANASLQSLLDQTTSSADKAGKDAGDSFGSSFLSVVQAYLAQVSLSALTGEIQDAVSSYKLLQKASLNLGSTIDATNQSAESANQQLKSGNLTLEQQGNLLGINTSKLYTNESATKANAGAVNALQNQINLETQANTNANNALQAQIDLRNQQIKAINDQTNAQVAQIQSNGGYDQLLNQKDSYDLQLNSLDAQKTQLQLSGGFTANIDQQISQLTLQKQLNDDKLNAINIQTSAIQRQGKTQTQVLQDQVTNLQAQLTSSKNTFNIDIQPAKDKLQNLKSELQSMGNVKVLNQPLADSITAAAKVGVAQIDSSGMQDAMQKLYTKYGGLVDQGTLSSAFTNVIQAGITDTQQVSGLVDRYVNSASIARGPGVSLTNAILESSNSIKNGTDPRQSGLNITSKAIEEKGTQLLGAQRGQVLNYNDLSKSDQALAKYQGTMALTTAKANGLSTALSYNKDGTINFSDSIKKGYLTQELYNAKLAQTQQAIGGDLAPAYNTLGAELFPVLQGFTNFVVANPQLVVAITAVATALTAVLTASLGISSLLKVFGPVISSISGFFTEAAGGAGLLSTALEVLSGPIGWIIAAIALLTAGVVYLWNSNEGFRNAIINAWQEVVKWVLWAKDHWLEALGEVIGFFITLPIKIPIWISDAMTAMWNIISKFDWGNAWNGLVDGVMKAWDSIKNFFSNINWGDLLKNIGNGFKDLFKGIFKGILSGIPGLNVDDTLKKIGLYANGGYFTKPTLGVFGEAGDEAILNMNAIRMLGLTPNSVNALNSGGMTQTSTSSVSGSYNQSSNNYINNFGSFFGPSTQSL